MPISATPSFRNKAVLAAAGVLAFCERTSPSEQPLWHFPSPSGRAVDAAWKVDGNDRRRPRVRRLNQRRAGSSTNRSRPAPNSASMMTSAPAKPPGWAVSIGPVHVFRGDRGITLEARDLPHSIKRTRNLAEPISEPRQNRHRRCFPAQPRQRLDFPLRGVRPPRRQRPHPPVPSTQFRPLRRQLPVGRPVPSRWWSKAQSCCPEDNHCRSASNIYENRCGTSRRGIDVIIGNMPTLAAAPCTDALLGGPAHPLRT